MATHFLADLHLDDSRDEYARLLTAYLAGPARTAEAIYVLGDLFEVWIGDDGSLAQHRATLDAFAQLVASGVAIFFMRGNRDFAVGEAFQQVSGMCLLDDPCVIDLYGVPTLLSHGDLFCTDDLKHQHFRTKYTDPVWRKRRLRLPLWLRRRAAARARRKSRYDKHRNPPHIMDVNSDAVRRIMLAHGVRQLIHGHTHRPATHEFTLDGDPARRIVLPDWRPDQTGVLVVDADGHHVHWLGDAIQ